jgi:hypothetical protein
MVTTGSLARVPPDRLRVLPKARTPAGGGSVGTLSRYVCALLTSVDVRSHKLPTRRRGRTGSITSTSSCCPGRSRCGSRTSASCRTPRTRRRRSRRTCSSSARPGRSTSISSTGCSWGHTKKSRTSMSCCCRKAPWTRPSLTTSKRFSPSTASRAFTQASDLVARDGRLGSNWVHTGVSPSLELGGLPHRTRDQWFHVRHNKHNRWLLDERQIYQFHLGGALHPHIHWWEAMEIPRRSIDFIQFGGVRGFRTPRNLPCRRLRLCAMADRTWGS